MIVGTGVPYGASSYARAGAVGSGGGVPMGGLRGQTVHVGGGDGCCGPSGTVLANSRNGSGIGASGSTALQANPGCGIGSGASDTGCCIGGPMTSCGGVGSACFEGAGTMVTTTDWTYAGEGRGEFNKAAYNYVGEGAGSHAKETIAVPYTKETMAIPYGCRLRPCCMFLGPLLFLLPFLLYYLHHNTTAPTPMPTAAMQIPVPPPPPPLSPRPSPRPPSRSHVPVPVPKPMPVPAPAPARAFGAWGTCNGWGDPHVRTFDGIRADYGTPGAYYIVKSKQISIQVRYTPTKFTKTVGVTKMLAIGGPLLKGNKLIIGPLAATWNGAPILQGFPSHFAQPGILTVDYNNVGTLVDTDLDPSKKQIVHVKIDDGTPLGLTIQINRWTASPGNEYIDWKISMHSLPGQDGLCGNFNGNAVDDNPLAVHQRIGAGVPAGPELLLAS